MLYKKCRFLIIVTAINLLVTGGAEAQYITPDIGFCFEDDIKNILINNNIDAHKKILVNYSYEEDGFNGSDNIDAIYTFESNSIIKCFYIGTHNAPNKGLVFIRDSSIGFGSSSYRIRAQDLKDEKPVTVHLDSAGYTLLYTYSDASRADTAIGYSRLKKDSLGRVKEELDGDSTGRYLDKYFYSGDNIVIDSGFFCKESKLIFNDANTKFSFTSLNFIKDSTIEIVNDTNTGNKETTITVKRCWYSKNGELVKATSTDYNNSGNYPTIYSITVQYRK